MKVSNRKFICRLSVQTMADAKSRNVLAISAIALTTILFTALFTIALSINDSVQQANFRQVGGIAHGTLKYLTSEQVTAFKEDPTIPDYGLRLFVGMPQAPPFHKSQVEVSYCDENTANWMFLTPTQGQYPKEGTREAFTDTQVLSLLGVEPKLGTEFTLNISVNGVESPETFTLSGWHEYDPAILASHILIPESRAKELLAPLDLENPGPNLRIDPNIGTWQMDLMFPNAFRAEEKILALLEKHGYQNERMTDPNDIAEYLSIGINPAYTGSRFSFDPENTLPVAGLLLLILFTGYLMIYNVFQISVIGDVRLYGLLKTVGTTSRQLKRIILFQALFLSLAGIPLGLALGYLVGVHLSPAVLTQLDGIAGHSISISPFIFLFSSIFALITVLISCRRPGRLAAKVSPIEAVGYSEGSRTKKRKSLRNANTGTSLFKMAWANLWRNRSKTLITVVSLSLAVVLLNLTVSFVRGFDLEKYLRQMTSDFIVADAGYFQVSSLWERSMSLSEETIQAIAQQKGITAGGRIYGLTTPAQHFIPESRFRKNLGRLNPPEIVDAQVARSEKSEGRIADNVQLSGMEAFPREKLQLIEGDLRKLAEPGSRYIAAVCHTNDHGKPTEDDLFQNPAKIGDRIRVRYVAEWQYYDGETHREISSTEEAPSWYRKSKIYHDVDYVVAALVSVPTAISYRFYSSDEFILNDQTFIQDTGTKDVLLYAFDSTDESAPDMEAFLRHYSQEIKPSCDYESRESYASYFYEFRNMFLLVGSVLCFIIALVGILNFLNATLTGIFSRRREFALLQSIGMTGKQLKTMLILEGLCHSLGAALVSLTLYLLVSPLLPAALEGLFWFLSYRFTILPILLVIPIFAMLGVILPLLTYHVMAKGSVVARLGDSGM